MNITLESGIDVPPCINVASGKFDKKNKRSPWKKIQKLLNVGVHLFRTLE